MFAKALLPALVLSLTALSAPAGAIPPPPDPLCPLPEGTVVLCVTIGDVAFDRDLVFVDLEEGVEVAGYIDRYRWPTNFAGNVIIIPCLNATIDGDHIDPCGDLGLEWDSRVGGVAEQAPHPQASSRTINVREAKLDALVFGFGFDDEEILIVDPKELCPSLQVDCTAST